MSRTLWKKRSGKIINIASLLSFQGGILVPAYAAANGGIAQLTKALANEWAQDAINVNPADVVGPVLFLASEKSSCIREHVLAVDGGWLPGRTRLTRVSGLKISQIRL